MLTIAGIKVESLYKSYQISGQSVEVLKNLELLLDTSCITVILGRSGCGKTTFLRVVSGLETKDSGSITFENKIKTGMIFQEPRLMPWLNVWQNITLGLKKKGIQPETITQLIEITGLTGFEQAYPSQLSGGMQQRVALARVLAYDASYILMDEPFAALDYFTRKSMQDELLRIQQAQKTGILFVTHSIDEALTLGHNIVIFEKGKCKQNYNLSWCPYPRDLLSPDIIALKRDIITNIEKGDII